MNQENNFYQNVVPKLEKENFGKKIRNMLKQKNTRKIIIALATLIVATIVLIISICLITNSNRKNTLKDNTWKDLIINIDGNIIKLGDKISFVETIGFTTDSEYYNGELSQKFTSGGLPFVYKNTQNSILFSAYNSTKETKKVSDCELSEIEITSDFFKEYNITLPGKILLTEKTTIDDIVKTWNKATNETENSYSWIDGKKEIRIYTNNDKTISRIVYKA